MGSTIFTLILYVSKPPSNTVFWSILGDQRQNIHQEHKNIYVNFNISNHIYIVYPETPTYFQEFYFIPQNVKYKACFPRHSIYAKGIVSKSMVRRFGQRLQCIRVSTNGLPFRPCMQFKRQVGFQCLTMTCCVRDLLHQSYQLGRIDTV